MLNQPFFFVYEHTQSFFQRKPIMLALNKWTLIFPNSYVAKLANIFVKQDSNFLCLKKSEIKMLINVTNVKLPKNCSINPLP